MAQAKVRKKLANLNIYTGSRLVTPTAVVVEDSKVDYGGGGVKRIKNIDSLQKPRFSKG